MALTFLMNEETQYFNIWENSPRLPKSVQEQFASVSPEEKMTLAIDYYTQHEALEPLILAMSTIGFSPIEPIQAISRDGELIVFDGCRRLIAAKLLLEPELAETTRYSRLIKEARAGMSEENIESLMSLPVVKFNPHAYSLDTIAFSHNF